MRSRIHLAFLLAVTLLLAACGDEPVYSTSTTAGSETTAAVTTSTDTPPTTAPPAGAMAEDLASLVAVTEEIRGLPFLVDPVITVVSPAELAERVRAQIEEQIDPADMEIEAAFYRLLGILPPGIDLAQAWTDLYSEQVAGFYDHETKELVVSGDSQLTPLVKTIVVHELVHALADQHFDLGARLDALIDEERYHEASAFQALAEGEATYFQIVYFQSLPPEEQFRAAVEALEHDTTVLDSLPAWFARDLAFPYDQGFVFVEALIAANGIAAVDQAYRRPPTTTEQIIHPEKYGTLESARQVALPDDIDLPGYETYFEGEFGEWNLRLYLLDGVDAGQAEIAAGGWGGDRARILWNGAEVVFLYAYEGDTRRDAEEFARNLEEAVALNMAVGGPARGGDGSVTYRGDDYAWILIDGSSVFFVAASDPASGSAAAARMVPVAAG